MSVLEFKRATKFTCELCGEELTCPYIHNGKIYGWTCIKKVNPSARKPKDIANWVVADNYEFERLERGLKIRAFKTGLKFIDILPDSNPYGFKNIIVQNERAFINASVYKNGYKIIYTNPQL